VRFLAITHAGYEDLGAVGAAARRLRLTQVNLSREDLVGTESLDRVELVVSAGSLSAPLTDPPSPQVIAEQRLLSRASASGVPVLGVCFGAQLLAANAGAKLYRLAIPRSGWSEVTLKIAGETLHENGFFWNSWGFELPQNATELSCGPEACWAFAEDRALGLQFHLDATPALLERWITDQPDAALQKQRRNEWIACQRNALRRNRVLADWLVEQLVSAR
jgi:GMP synthase-like glutamine amidotransferase